MVDDRRIEEEVDKTLRSYDNEGSLDENPFIFSRIQATRAERLRRSGHRLRLRPALTYAAVALLLLLNVITALYAGRLASTTLHDRLISELKADLQIEEAQDYF